MGIIGYQTFDFSGSIFPSHYQHTTLSNHTISYHVDIDFDIWDTDYNSDNWEHVSYELVAPYSEGGVNYISTAAGKLNLIRVHRTKVIFLVQHKLTDCLCWLFNIGFYRTQVYLGSDLWVFKTNRPLWNLTELTLADEDNNSIPTDDVNRAIIGNVAKLVTNADINFLSE